MSLVMTVLMLGVVVRASMGMSVLSQSVAMTLAAEWDVRDVGHDLKLPAPGGSLLR